jgi:transglycosylase-like protein with SLT domain
MVVDAAGSGSGPSVAGAIRQASRLTGTSFDYLLATAQVESGLNPRAQATTSSAGGLFQFIEQTWLATLKEAGPNLGYGRYADTIVRTDSGRYAVSDPALRDQILKLRHDPTANALMAGAFTRNNAAKLADRLGRGASEGELYMAHFLGPAGAARLITRAGDQPDARAADLFPHAARANRSIFYDRQGRARSVAQVYGVLAGRYQLACAAPAVPATVTADKPSVRPRMAAVADPAGVAGAFAANAPPIRPVDDGQVFHSLFRTGERREPVAPAVSELWTAQAAAGAASVAMAPAGAAHGGPLDLFQTMRPDVRALFGTKS